MRVLFVCTGNICRSPVAERLTHLWATRRGAAGVRPASAGTHAVVGHPLDNAAAQALTDLGGDPRGFIARQVTARDIDGADLVLTMGRAHRTHVLGLAPRALRRTFTLTEASMIARHTPATTVAELAAARGAVHGAASAPDVPDPFGCDAAFHRDVAQMIARHAGIVLNALAGRPGSKRERPALPPITSQDG